MERANVASREESQIRQGCLEILGRFHVVGTGGAAAHMMAGRGKVSR